MAECVNTELPNRHMYVQGYKNGIFFCKSEKCPTFWRMEGASPTPAAYSSDYFFVNCYSIIGFPVFTDLRIFVL